LIDGLEWKPKGSIAVYRPGAAGGGPLPQRKNRRAQAIWRTICITKLRGREIKLLTNREILIGDAGRSAHKRALSTKMSGAKRFIHRDAAMKGLGAHGRSTTPIHAISVA